MNKIVKADLYQFCIHYLDHELEHFNDVKNYRFVFKVAKNELDDDVSVYDVSQKKEVKEAVDNFVKSSYEYKQENDDHGTRSSYHDDQQKLVDFIEKCQDENGKFLIYTIDGTDANILFVNDYEEFMSYSKIKFY